MTISMTRSKLDEDADMDVRSENLPWKDACERGMTEVRLEEGNTMKECISYTGDHRCQGRRRISVSFIIIAADGGISEPELEAGATFNDCDIRTSP